MLFEKHSGIGDIICTFPAAIELKKRHAGAETIYNCHPDYTCLPILGGVADHTTSKREIGVVGYWYHFLLSGYYQFGSDDDNPNVIPTEVYIKDFGRAFGLQLRDLHPQLPSRPDTISRAQSLLQKAGIGNRPFIAIHPGPSWTVREWPHESWEQLVAGLRAHGFIDIIRLGTGKVLRFGDVQVDSIPGTYSLVDQLTLEESIAIISLATLFIGIDSGLLHIAAAVRTPAVGIWGPTLPHLRFNRETARSFVTSNVECRGCQHQIPRLHWFTGCPFEIACMKSISVEEVLAACLSRICPK